MDTIAMDMIDTMAGKGQEDGFLPLFALRLMMKVLGKGVRRARGRYNNTDYIDISF